MFKKNKTEDYTTPIPNNLLCNKIYLGTPHKNDGCQICPVSEGRLTFHPRISSIRCASSARLLEVQASREDRRYCFTVVAPGNCKPEEKVSRFKAVNLIYLLKKGFSRGCLEGKTWRRCTTQTAIHCANPHRSPFADRVCTISVFCLSHLWIPER